MTIIGQFASNTLYSNKKGRDKEQELLENQIMCQFTEEWVIFPKMQSLKDMYRTDGAIGEPSCQS